MRPTFLLATLIACCGASRPATRPSTQPYLSFPPGQLQLRLNPILPPGGAPELRINPPQTFDPTSPDMSAWLRIPPDAVKKNVGMNTEHYVITLSPQHTATTPPIPSLTITEPVVVVPRPAK